MNYILHPANWHMELADAIEQALDGDKIIVHNAAMKELAESFSQGVCPEKKLTFEIKEPPSRFDQMLK